MVNTNQQAAVNNVHNTTTNIYINEPTPADGRKFEQDGYFNLSDRVIPTPVNNVLHNGLKFIPLSDNSVSAMKLSTVTALQRSLRNMEIKLFFAMDEDDNNNPLIPRIDGSTWRPPECSETWYQPFHSFSERVMGNLFNLPYHQLLTRSNNDDIALTKQWLLDNQCIIKPSDKNLGPCVLTNQLYLRLCHAHLDVQANYSAIGDPDELIADPYRDTPTVTMQRSACYVNHTYENLIHILQAHNAYQKDTPRAPLTKLAKSLLQLQTSPRLRLPVFYVLPKVHKLVKENPDIQQLAGRPIVSNTLSHSYHTSKFLHNLLILLLIHVFTIINSSSAALARMRSTVVSNTDIVFCADVKALYPSIPTEFGLQATRAFIKKYAPHLKVDLIIDLLEWVLCSNYFEFNGTLYHQRNGTAMGTPVAPTYANIVLFQMESELVLTASPRLFMRYLDDLFGIFRSRAAAEQYVREFNAICPDIQLESVTYGDNGIFLDIMGYIDDTSIKTRLYQKPMNRYLYIKPQSRHQKHVFRNFIRSELRRYRLYCTEDADYDTCVHLFQKRLIRRGYSYAQIADASFDLPNIPTNQENAAAPRNRLANPPIICLPSHMQRVLRSHPDLLQLPEELTGSRSFIAAYGSAARPMQTYMNDPSIGSMITRSKF